VLGGVGVVEGWWMGGVLVGWGRNP